MNGKRILSVDEFCAAYGIGRTTAYKEMDAGNLRARKVGKKTVILVDDAEKWMKSLVSQATHKWHAGKE